MIQELKREIAVHDNASVADKLLSCLDSNYCLTLLNPWGSSTIHVDSEGEGRRNYPTKAIRFSIHKMSQQRGPKIAKIVDVIYGWSLTRMLKSIVSLKSRTIVH